MATNKSYEERIKIQKDIMEKAELKIKELEEAAKKEEAEKKKKKIDGILRDVERALSQSPVLEISKSSDDYKRFLSYIKNGVGQELFSEKQKENVTLYIEIGKIIEAEIGRNLSSEDKNRLKTFIEKQDARGNYFRKTFEEVE